MKKNLLDKGVAQQIIIRAGALSADSKNKWGEMNVTEMLFHCNLANEQIFDEEMEYRTPTIKQRLLKVLSLYVVPVFPKNMRGAKRNDTKGRININLFEEQKQKFVYLINRFPEHPLPITLIHPAFGYLTTRQWGIAAWMHIDHHLRQFGV